jgi:hypothetical protein
MITLNKNDKVKVKVFGRFETGTLLDYCDASFEPSWWVEIIKDNYRDVIIFSEEELYNWNSVNKVCTCGSAKAGVSNRHSYYCDAYEKY